MRGRLRGIARATHRRHLLIWHVEAGSVKLSERAGAIGMDSSLAQSLAGVILPGELTDFPNPRTNPHIERGRLQGIGHPPDRLPTRTLEIRDSRKAPQKPKTGEHRPISTSVTNSHTNPGHHRTPSHGCTNSHAKPGHHQPLAHLKAISRNHPGFAPPSNASTHPMPLRPAQTQQKTAHPSGHAVDARLNCRGRHRHSTRKRHAGSPPRHGHEHGLPVPPDDHGSRCGALRVRPA